MTTITIFGNLYLGNKMSRVPFFNAPWFDETAAWLRRVPGVASVFNPADEDRLNGFEPMNCPNGTMEEAIPAGFVASKALGADWAFIANYSDGLVIGPDALDSPGTISEIACHQALSKPVWEFKNFKEIAEGLSHGHLYSDSWQFPQLRALLG